jgi:dolichol-phosphate mannosyltransferase
MTRGGDERHGAIAANGRQFSLTALLALLVGFALLLRLIGGARIELLPEEAYYWNYSRHLDLGYLDHPPLVAWLIRLGTLLFGNTEFGVRCGALVCGAVTGFFTFRLTLNVFGATRALLALGLLQVLPFFFLSGMLMTPDAPLTAAWAAALYFLERALIAGQARAWLWAGLAVGVGLTAKYTIALLGMAALVFMLLDAPSRGWFRRWQPYAAVGVAAAVFAPVIYWNATHAWASFAFQTSRRLAEAPRFSLHKFLGSTLVLLSPVGLAAAAAALYGSAAPLRARRLLQVAVLVPLAVFAVFSVRHEVKLDWTGAPWTAVVPLLANGWGDALGGAPGAKRWLRVAWPPTIVGMLLIYTIGCYYLTHGIRGLGYSRHTELVPVEWRDFGRQIDGVADALRAKYGERLLIVGMDRYAIASELAFYAHDQAKSVAATSSAHLFGDVGLMYEWWFPAPLQTGRTLLLIAWDPANLAAAHLQNRAALEPVQQGVLMRDGKEVRRYFYRVAHDYRYP